jgi:hypothetical protein
MDCNGLTHTLVDDGSVAADGVWAVPQTGYQPQSNGDQERVMSVDDFVRLRPGATAPSVRSSFAPARLRTPTDGS